MSGKGNNDWLIRRSTHRRAAINRLVDDTMQLTVTGGISGVRRAATKKKLPTTPGR